MNRLVWIFFIGLFAMCSTAIAETSFLGLTLGKSTPADLKGTVFEKCDFELEEKEIPNATWNRYYLRMAGQREKCNPKIPGIDISGQAIYMTFDNGILEFIVFGSDWETENGKYEQLEFALMQKYRKLDFGKDSALFGDGNGVVIELEHEVTNKTIRRIFLRYSVDSFQKKRLKMIEEHRRKELNSAKEAL